MLRFLTVALVACAFAVPAVASGGLSCEANDSAAKLSVESGISNAGGGLFQLSGRLQLSNGAIARDLRDVSFERADATQFSYDGSTLRLVLYRERHTGEHATIKVSIDTKHTAGGGEYELAGTYEVAIHDYGASQEPVKFSGRAKCSLLY
jgi:hypothetical protein